MRSLEDRNLGHYRLVEQIGAGGMAVVYKAFDPTLDRYVAIKILPETLADDAEFTARFRAEARNVAQLEHPNILPIYGYGEQDGLTYFVMGLVKGGTLQKLMSAGMDLQHAVSILDQIASALQHAHDQGIVHRDVKPANVLMARPDWPLLSDFGIARVLQHRSSLTRSGSGYLGTPYYMAPEQASGEEISPQTDQYALGIVLYEMLTGAAPFQADTPQAVVYQHLFSPPPLPHERNPAVTGRLEQVVLRAIAKVPSDRFPTIAAFASAARESISDSVPVVEPPYPEPASPATAGDLTDVAPADSPGVGSTAFIERSGFGTEHLDQALVPDRNQAIGPTTNVQHPEPRAHRDLLGHRFLGIPVPFLVAGILVLFVLAIGVARYTLLSRSSKPAVALASRGRPVASWGRAGSQPGQFAGPHGVTLNPDGTMYVVDTGNNRLQKLSRTGKVLAVWGSKGSKPRQFSHPLAVAIDKYGNLYVADTGNHRIQKLSPTGKFLGAWSGSGPEALSSPSGVAVDAAGHVYVADGDGDRIEAFSPTGRVLAVWGDSGSAPGQFLSPVAVALDPMGNVYVAEADNNRIQKLSPRGKPLAVWGSAGSGPGQFNGPSYVALDLWGNMYVTDVLNNRIQKLSPSGRPLAVWGTRGTKAGDFRAPAGVTVDPGGNVYVADTGNNRLQKFSSAGHMLFAWGKAGNRSGQFHTPTGIAVDRQDNVYVADTQNYRIQKFSSTGEPLATWGVHGSGLGQFVLPIALAVDSDDNIYVADLRQSSIQKLSASGKPLARWGTAGSGPGQFRSPQDIAVDSKGNLYVADTGNLRVQKLSPTGAPLAQWKLAETGAAAPNGLTVDHQDHVYVTASVQSSGRPQSEVLKFSSRGKRLVVWGDVRKDSGRFAFPVGIAVDRQNALYVADPGQPLNEDPHRYHGSVRIGKLSPSGQLLAFWESRWADGGPLRFPVGIAVDSHRNIYVADAGTDSVVKIVPSG